MEIGDLVRLKCGGPIMVIIFLPDADSENIKRPTCIWFNRLDEKQQDSFREDILVSVEKVENDDKWPFQL